MDNEFKKGDRVVRIENPVGSLGPEVGTAGEVLGYTLGTVEVAWEGFQNPYNKRSVVWLSIPKTIKKI